MPDRVKEKLVELCEDVILSCKSSLCDDCEHNCIDYPNCMGVHFADHLIANGVTFANDNNVGKFLPAGTKMFIEACERELANNGTGREMRFVGGDSPVIASGVTVQQWIPVKDGLPKLIPCDAGTAYSEAVNVLTSGRKVLTAIWDGFDWICDAEFWDAEDEEITHWTPVLLPLPQPPKGE